MNRLLGLLVIVRTPFQFRHMSANGLIAKEFCRTPAIPNAINSQIRGVA